MSLLTIITAVFLAIATFIVMMFLYLTVKYLVVPIMIFSGLIWFFMEVLK